jgi:hypothetical protein
MVVYSECSDTCVSSSSSSDTWPRFGSRAKDGIPTFHRVPAPAAGGIPNEWKRNGVTIDPGSGNPPQFVDRPKMCVTLDRPNVLVQVDWMEDDTPRNQQLRQAAIDTVINAFDQDPVTHRGATRSGITLIVDAGPDSTITPGGATWGSLSRAKPVTWTQDFLTATTDGGYQAQRRITTRLPRPSPPRSRRHALSPSKNRSDHRCSLPRRCFADG